MSEPEWWEPTLTDDKWIARVREDFPDECADLSDDAVREKYAGGQKYQTLWDNLGDAKEEHERLADAFLALRLALAEATERLACAEELAVAARVERDEARRDHVAAADLIAMRERERDEARAEATAAMDRLRGLTARALAAEALSRAREPEDGAVREAAEIADKAMRDVFGGVDQYGDYCGHPMIPAKLAHAVQALLSALSSPPRPGAEEGENE